MPRIGLRAQQGKQRLLRMLLALSFQTRTARFLVLLVLFLLPALAAGQANASMVYEQPGNQWFEEPVTELQVSPDGQSALFTGMGSTVRLVSLKDGQEHPERLSADLNSVPKAAVFCGSRLARLVKRGADYGWSVSGNDESQLGAVPSHASPTCSSDGNMIAYYFPYQQDKGIFFGPIGRAQHYEITGEVTGAAFAPGGKAVYALTFGTDGKSSLFRVSALEARAERIATDLDAQPWTSRIAVTPDGRSIFVALATDTSPDNVSRQLPNAHRWLKIYQIDLTTGSRHVVAESENQDNFDPAVADGRLYWNRNVIHAAIALLPIVGGEANEVVAGGQLPVWSFDGGRLSYYFGDLRLVDWALNLDAGIVGVDAQGKPTSEPRVIVSGYHEDFPAAVSPNGRWIAFHSHRSLMPLAEYLSPGHSDDIYLRRADDPKAPEIRLTDFGWEAGPAFWSPDGSKLIFSSWQKGGQWGIDKTWVISLEPESGEVLNIKMLPLPSSVRSSQWVSWSPDGKEIAIEDNRGGEDRIIWIAPADGSRVQKLIAYKGTTYGGLDWRPDGKTIIYSGLTGDRMQLFEVPRQGGAPRQLSHDAGNLLHPRVSPKGRWIACTRLVQSQQVWSMPLQLAQSH